MNEEKSFHIFFGVSLLFTRFFYCLWLTTMEEVRYLLRKTSRNNYRTAVMKSNRLHVICISRDIWMGVLIEKTSVTLE